MNFIFNKTTAAASAIAIPFLYPLSKPDNNIQPPANAYHSFQGMEIDSMPLSCIKSYQSQMQAGQQIEAENDFSKEFHLLVKQWEHETSFHSSLGEIFTNDAYQRIMARGDEALPLILTELRRKPGHWFYALEKIVGRDVAASAKNFAEARALWLEWGYNNNYI